MAKYSIEDSTLTNIANAIRAKTGGTAALKPTAMDEALNGIPTQAAKTVTPSTADQTAVAKGVFTTGAVTVRGDANLKAENIAEGVSIFGVAGAFKAGKKTVRVQLGAHACTVYYADENGVLQTVAANTTGTINALGGVITAKNSSLTLSCTGSYLLLTPDYGASSYLAVMFFEDGGTINLTAGSGQPI